MHTETLEKLWALPDGCLYKLRQGQFDSTEAESLVETLRQICFADDASIPKRTVSLIWFMPQFIEWQEERVLKHSNTNPTEFARFANEVHEEVQRILGVP